MCRKEGKINIKQNNPDKHKTLDIDHIKPLEHYPELGYDMDNLQTLCIRHHNEKENRFNKSQSKKKRWQDEWWWKCKYTPIEIFPDYFPNWETVRGSSLDIYFSKTPYVRGL